MNGYRFRVARELNGLTQAELAQEIGVTQSSIAQIEGGRLLPSSDLAEALAQRLEFPLAYFNQDDPPDFPSGSLLYRAHSGLSAIERAEAERYGQVVFEASVTLGRRIKNKTSLRLPQLGEEPSDAAGAAQLTRDALGVSPDTPIPHLIRAVERIGVRVLAVPKHLEKRDAYSLWARSQTLWSASEFARPVIVVFSGVSGDRLRFSVAHELGHLVMHQAIRGVSRELEEEANRFAAELLLPESAMRQRIVPPVTLAHLAELKPIWGVSVQALLLRARDLSIVSARQYRYLWSRLVDYGWQTEEPIEIVPEKPRALRQMAELIYKTPIDYQRLAADLCLTPHFAKRMIEAHATREEFAVRTTEREGGGDNVLDLTTRRR